jgi:hypothetical protein
LAIKAKTITARKNDKFEGPNAQVNSPALIKPHKLSAPPKGHTASKDRFPPPKAKYIMILKIIANNP